MALASPLVAQRAVSPRARALLQVPLLVGLSVLLVFVLVRLAPGDATDAVLPADATSGARAALRAAWGLDAPLPVQVGRWAARAARGDWGVSVRNGQPVGALLAAALPASVLLGGAALAGGVAAGLGLAGVQAARPDGRVDRALSALSLGLGALPSAWVGLLLIAGCGVQARLFPLSGLTHPLALPGRPPHAVAADIAWHLVLPATTLGLGLAVTVARFTRAELLDQDGRPWVEALRSRGFSERAVLWRHRLPAALGPVRALVGLALPGLVGGAAVVESVFAWPGMGRLLVDAALAQDVPVLVGGVAVVATAVGLGRAAAAEGR